MSYELTQESLENLEKRKIEAEIKKIKKETEEIEKLHKWDSTKAVQIIIGGLIAAAIATAWGFNVLRPFWEQEERLERVKTEILAEENKKQKLDIEKREKALVEENEKLRKEVSKILEDNKSLLAIQEKSNKRSEHFSGQLKKLSQDYQKLANEKNLTASQRDRYRKLANASKKEVTGLQGQIKQFKDSQKDTVKRTKKLEKQLKTREIKGVDISIFYAVKRKRDAEKIHARLTEVGGIVFTGSTDDGYVCDGNRLVFSLAKLKNAALQVKKLIDDIEVLKVNLFKMQGNGEVQLYLCS